MESHYQDMAMQPGENKEFDPYCQYIFIFHLLALFIELYEYQIYYGWLHENQDSGR